MRLRKRSQLSVILTHLIAEEKQMNSQKLKLTVRLLAVACVAALPFTATAQDAAAPAAHSTRPAYGSSPSRWDIFAGYSYLAPKGTIDTPMPNGQTIGFNYKSVDWGAILSVARYFNKNVGIEAIGDEHILNQTPCNCGTGSTYSPNDFSGGSGGIIFRFPTGNLTPFVHALAGAELVGGPEFQTDKWGPVLTAGGGADYNTPLFNHHLAIRVFQADYQYIHENYGPGVLGGRGNINAARLSTGFVYHIGSIAPPTPVTMACSANPTTVFPGENVTLTGNAGNLDPKANTVYNWSGEGVTGNGSSATVNTASLAPGTYTVKCGVKQGKKGQEGLKPWESADSSTTFTVKQFEPPTISCAANPSTIKPGETSTITATGVSPQNRPLTYTYSAASGTVSGNGSSATFNSTGAPAGPVEVTCNVSDDKGQTASSGTSITIQAPPPPPQPHTQALCSITFSKDKARPTRVDNEAKACLDDVALDLQKQPDAKAVVVGNQDSKEQAKMDRQQKLAQRNKHLKVQNFAAERAVNTKDYLVNDKGIDASRISVMTGSEPGQSVSNYLVPAGASFSQDVQGASPVDESTIKPLHRKEIGTTTPHKSHKAASKSAAN